MSEEASNVDLQILIAQYEQCWTDIRDHRNRQWQIPLASGLVDTGILAAIVTLRSAASICVRIVFSIMLIVIAGAFIIQLHKERFFEINRTVELDGIRQRLLTLGGMGFPVLFKTTDIINSDRPDIPRGWIYRRTAFNWLCCSITILDALTIAAIFLIK